MKADIIIDHETQKVKLIFDWKAGIIGQKLTADETEDVVKLIEAASREANREAFKQWLMQFECHENDIVIDGKTYRFKMVAEKKFLTRFGVIDATSATNRVAQNFPTGQRRPNFHTAGRCLGNARRVRDVRRSRVCALHVGKGTDEGKAWYRKMEALLLEYDDGVHRVIRSLEYYLADYEYKESSRKLIESCLTFFVKQFAPDGVQTISRQRLTDWQRPGFCATSAISCATSATRSRVQKHRETLRVALLP